MRKLRKLCPAVMMLVLGLAGCHRAKPVSRLALEQCDPAGYIPCLRQDSFLAIPVVDSNLLSTYSSRWRASSDNPGKWDAGQLGLGGWSMNIVQRYDSGPVLPCSNDPVTQTDKL